MPNEVHRHIVVCNETKLIIPKTRSIHISRLMLDSCLIYFSINKGNIYTRKGGDCHEMFCLPVSRIWFSWKDMLRRRKFFCLQQTLLQKRLLNGKENSRVTKVLSRQRYVEKPTKSIYSP